MGRVKAIIILLLRPSQQLTRTDNKKTYNRIFMQISCTALSLSLSLFSFVSKNEYFTCKVGYLFIFKYSSTSQ